MLLPKRKWKDIEDYEGLYQVSNTGEVRSLNYRYTGEKKILKQSTNKGYKQVNLYKNGKLKAFRVHRLVAQAFIPNPQNKPQINHIDENKTNNCMWNLEWTTAKENINHGTRNERANKKISKNRIGAKNPNAKKVMCLNNGMIFDCIKDAMKWSGVKSCNNIREQIQGRYKTIGHDPVTGEKLKWQYID